LATVWNSSAPLPVRRSRTCSISANRSAPRVGPGPHAGGRHPGHHLARRFAVLFHLADRGQEQGPLVSPAHPGAFAVVSPLLGPLIDRSRGAGAQWWCCRRRAAPSCARSWHETSTACSCSPSLLDPRALEGLPGHARALVPEMVAEAATEGTRPAAGMTNSTKGFSAQLGYAGLNARLTLLGRWRASWRLCRGSRSSSSPVRPGCCSSRRASSSEGRSPECACRCCAAAIGRPRQPLAAFRRRRCRPGGPNGSGTVDRDLARLQPIAHPEVLFGLSANALLRGVAGFFIFLLAFVCEESTPHSGGTGSPSRERHRRADRAHARAAPSTAAERATAPPRAIWLVSLAALIAAAWHTLLAQVFLALIIGISGAIGQPSFDALTQRYVAPAAQGRAFARFATRQQLVWVVGALIRSSSCSRWPMATSSSP